MSLKYGFRLCFKDGTTRLVGERGISIRDLLENLKPFLDAKILYDIKDIEDKLSIRDILQLGIKSFKPFCHFNCNRFEIINIETNQIVDYVENN